MDRSPLANGFLGGAIRDEIVPAERSGMRAMSVQGMHQRRPFLNDANPGMAVAVDPSLVALWQAKPLLQIQVVADVLEGRFAD